MQPSLYDYLPPPLKDKITDVIEACKNAPEEQLRILRRCFEGSKGAVAGVEVPRCRHSCLTVCACRGSPPPTRACSAGWARVDVRFLMMMPQPVDLAHLQLLHAWPPAPTPFHLRSRLCDLTGTPVPDPLVAQYPLPCLVPGPLPSIRSLSQYPVPLPVPDPFPSIRSLAQYLVP